MSRSGHEVGPHANDGQSDLAVVVDLFMRLARACYWRVA